MYTWKQEPKRAVYFVVALIVGLLIAIVANARDPEGKWEHSKFHEWFVSQLQEPDYPGDTNLRSCCGEADGHFVEVRRDDKAISGWAVLINGAWYAYDKPMAYHPNPTGRNVAWWNIEDDGLPFIFCLRLATGS